MQIIFMQILHSVTRLHQSIRPYLVFDGFNRGPFHAEKPLAGTPRTFAQSTTAKAV